MLLAEIVFVLLPILPFVVLLLVLIVVLFVFFPLKEFELSLFVSLFASELSPIL